ncbi:MAG: endonuclease/exonuclease/phosphatase family protein [Streptosporangiaceae bacterium]
MAAARTAGGSVLFGTYNTLRLFEQDSAAARARYAQVVEVIRALDTDVLAVQEIRADDDAGAQRGLAQLAADTGRRCQVPGAGGGPGRAAVATGPRGFHSGVLWRDGIEPVPGSLRCYGGKDFWHSLACVTLDVGGSLVRHAAYHATPFGRRLRADQNERLVAALTDAPGQPPVLVGADWNTECADRVPDPGSGDWVLYEPGDPYAAVPWFGAMVYQCEWDYDEHGRRRHWADRQPGDVLWAGGLHDAAAALRAPWQPTTGHHPDDPYGTRGVSRRIDAIRVTEPALGALRAHQVVDTALARGASDHLPVIVEYRPGDVGPAG